MIWVIVLFLLLFLLGGGYAFFHLALYIILIVLAVYAVAYLISTAPWRRR